MKSKDKEVPKEPLCDKTTYYVLRNEFFIIAHDASQAFNKLIVGFSSALLVLVPGLVLYSEEAAVFECLMGVAGMLLILAVCFSLYSLWECQRYSLKGVKHLNSEYRKHGGIEEPFDDPAIKKMIRYQKYSGMFFVAGMVFLLAFIILNLSR